MNLETRVLELYKQVQKLQKRVDGIETQSEYGTHIPRISLQKRFTGFSSLSENYFLVSKV